MAPKPFKEKELLKDKELSLSEKGDKDKEISKDKHEKEKHEKEKHEKNETKENKDKQEKEKQEKEKHEKEQKEQKEAKEHKEQKDKSEKHEKQEKEKHEKELKDRKEAAKEKESKHEQKELESLPADQAALAGTTATPAAEVTANKVIEKFQEKLFKPEKFEKHEKEKFEKFEKHEKFEFKELEKVQFDGKELVEGGINVLPGGDPLIGQRVAALESAVAQLMHFIPENLRPDLSQGALKQEPAAAGQTDQPAPTAEPAPQPREPDKGKK